MAALARAFLAGGALVMAAAVTLGAYAAHARGAPHPDAAHLLQTAVLYMLVHGLGLVACGILARSSASRWLAAAGVLLFAGVVLFCGSIAVLALTGTSLGAAPVGGSAFILGWLCLAVFGATMRRE
jgi:uncharacterized membrane protein YgdD (TMEM256/DUF423 family)